MRAHVVLRSKRGTKICIHCDCISDEIENYPNCVPCAPEPVTTEPPEWKVETHVCPFCSATCAVGTFCTCERGQDEMRRWDTIMQAPAQSPLDRALEDFTARRKAKREPSMSEIVTQALRRSVRVVAKGVPVDQRTEPLSRAMSTPLPHDPPMSARLMPWRGKE